MRGRAVCGDLASWTSCWCDGRHREKSSRLGSAGIPLDINVHRSGSHARLDDAAVRFAALGAHVVRLVPLFDQLDAVCGEAVAQRADRVGIGNGARKTTMSVELRIRESAKRDGLFAAWRAGNGGGR